MLCIFFTKIKLKKQNQNHIEDIKVLLTFAEGHGVLDEASEKW